MIQVPYIPVLEQEISACDGTPLTVLAPAIIQSPGYPKAYKPRSNSIWIVKMPLGPGKCSSITGYFSNFIN